MQLLTTETYAKGLRQNLQDALYLNEKMYCAVNTMLQALAAISDRVENQKRCLTEALSRDEIIIKRNSLPEPEDYTEEGDEE